MQARPHGSKSFSDDIPIICQSIGVTPVDFDKVRSFLAKRKSSLCHICMTPCIGAEMIDLRWEGDEQYICCGKKKCHDQFDEYAQLERIFAKYKNG